MAVILAQWQLISALITTHFIVCLMHFFFNLNSDNQGTDLLAGKMKTHSYNSHEDVKIAL